MLAVSGLNLTIMAPRIASTWARQCRLMWIALSFQPPTMTSWLARFPAYQKTFGIHCNRLTHENAQYAACCRHGGAKKMLMQEQFEWRKPLLLAS